MTTGARLQARGIPEGQVFERALDLAAHASDASHYQLTPKAVIVARDATDVASVLAACTRESLGVTFRSGGTSLSGQAVTNEILVDTRRHFKGLEVLDEGRAVRVQPGVTVKTVNTMLRRYGRRLGPDPASEAACTIGGVIANNSSGMSCGTHANAYRTVRALELVLPSGLRLNTAAPEADVEFARREPAMYEGLLELRDRVRANPQSVDTIRRLFALKNTMGYGVNAFLDFDDPIDILMHLVIGSEGTLAFVASATLATVPAPPHAATGLLILPGLVDAAELIPDIAATGAVSIELMDARSLKVSAPTSRALSELSTRSVGSRSALLVEYHAQTLVELESMEQGAAELFRMGGIGTQPLTRDVARRQDLWHVRKGLYSAVAGARPPGSTALLEDIAVPTSQLAQTCRDLGDLFERFGYDQSVIFGHAKDGNLHFLLNERFDNAAGVDRYAEFTDAMVDATLARGGTLKAEHGTGRVMAPFVRRQYGDELYEVMRSVKSLCDPQGVLNAGVVLTADPAAHLKNLKTLPAVEAEVDRCTECGYCEPVCPSRDLTMTPRQRIVVRRAIAAATNVGDQALAKRLSSDYDYAGLQTCAADGMCQTACPVAIDTGDLVRRLRSDAVPASGQVAGRVGARHWAGITGAIRVALTIAAWMPRSARLASRIARRLVGTRLVPEYDSLPAGGAARTPLSAETPTAIVIPSCTVGMFESNGTDALASLRELAEKAGVKLASPPDSASLCCGMPWSSKGLTAGHTEMTARLRASVERLDPLRSLPVISDASSCSEGIRKALTAAGWHVEDAVTFTARALLPNLDVRPLEGRLAVHPTCSSQRLDGSAGLNQIARALSPDVYVAPSWGCCAFAGDRGLLHPELTESATRQQAAEILGSGARWHVSCNRTCELGMSRATGIEYVHILALLNERVQPAS